MKIKSKTDFLININLVKCFLKNIQEENNLSENLLTNYFDFYDKSSLFYQLLNTDVFYNGGFYELKYINGELVGGSGVYVKNKIKYVYKRTYIFKKYRKQFTPNELFLSDQLKNQKCDIAINTYNEDQKRMFLGTKRILENKSIYLGQTTKQKFDNYFKYKVYVFDEPYLINNTKQFVVCFDVNNLGKQCCERILNNEFR